MVYRAMYRYELADAAGVSRRTFGRWLRGREAELRGLGVSPRCKLLPPAAVKWLCEFYCIDLKGERGKGNSETDKKVSRWSSP